MTEQQQEQRDNKGQFTKGNQYAKKTKRRKTRLEMFEHRLKQKHPTEKGTYSQAIVNKLIDMALEGDTKALLKVIDIMAQIDTKNSKPFYDLLP